MLMDVINLDWMVYPTQTSLNNKKILTLHVSRFIWEGTSAKSYMIKLPVEFLFLVVLDKVLYHQ